jgi:hypothetical protein
MRKAYFMRAILMSAPRMSAILMRTIFVSVMSAALTLAGAPAFALTGSALSQHCEQDVKGEVGWMSGFCQGYISGVSEDMLARGDICLPKGTNNRALYNFVGGALKAHPDSANATATLVIRDILAKAYPCVKH